MDVNDNSPVFSSTGYPVTFAENHEIGIPVAVISATDFDYGTNAIVSFSLVAGPDSSAFDIDKTTGAIWPTVCLHNADSFDYFNAL